MNEYPPHLLRGFQRKSREKEISVRKKGFSVESRSKTGRGERSADVNSGVRNVL